MRREQEWDYPPEQRSRRFYKVMDAEPDPMTSPTATRIASFYWRTVKMTFKILLGSFIGFFLVMLIWLFFQSFRPFG